MKPQTVQPLAVGLFLSFEGIDGAGKSSHLESLAQTLRDQGREVVVTREPGGTPLAESLRALVLNQPMDPLTESLLVFAARRDHLKQVIEPALALGKVVLCDRFTDATFAYQGGGRGLDWDLLTQLEQWVQGVGLPATGANSHAERLVQPDFTVWFDIPPAVAAQRLASARQADRFEAESLAFFQRVVQGYERRVQAQPHRFLRLDANTSREAVWDQLMQQLRHHQVLA